MMPRTFPSGKKGNARAKTDGGRSMTSHGKNGSKEKEKKINQACFLSDQRE